MVDELGCNGDSTMEIWEMMGYIACIHHILGDDELFSSNFGVNDQKGSWFIAAHFRHHFKHLRSNLGRKW